MENKEVSVSICDNFGEIEDPRMDRNKKHLLSEILFIALCSILVGGEHFTDMALFGRSKEQWLGRYLKLPNGVPSHDTFRRVFCLLKPEHFMVTLVEWTQALREEMEGEVVAIDGKSLRRTGKTKSDIVHVVSAWAATNRLVLGQIKVDEKSNEITAVPQLLRMLELSGCIVTLDAMGTQKNIAKEIHEADADYVLALKGNHGTAHQEIATFLDDAIAREAAHLDTYEKVEKDHGRIETRKAWITEETGWFTDAGAWENLRSFGAVELTRETAEAITTERRYFLCSIRADAKNFARAVRSHWGIENSLHWVLDVSLNEDQSRIRTDNAAENLALLRKMALNCLRKESSTPRKSIHAKQLSAALNQDYLLKILKIEI
jgi:predicted transposase YbfD/YdcC